MQAKERPILFSAPMVNAIREGRKTMTRRVVKPQPSMPWRAWDGTIHHWQDGDELMRCPYGQIGDRLWVRETWAVDAELDQVRREREDVLSGYGHGPYYRADRVHENTGLTWRPSIFMPRWASRITLEVVSVRVERVQEITAEGACAEGVPGCRDDLSNTHAVTWFATLWDQINGKRSSCSWQDNPWVWVVEFRPC